MTDDGGACGDRRNEGGMRGVSRVTLVMFVTRYVCLL